MDAAAGDDDRHIWSCVTCRRRKVKCDRREPCDVCVKTGIDCHYPVTGRLPKRARAPPQWTSPHQKQTDLLERLRRLEAVVTELSAQVDEANVEPKNAQMTPVSAALSSVEMEAGEDEDFGRLVTGGDGRVRIAKSFWSVFCDEVRYYILKMWKRQTNRFQVDHIFQSIQDTAEAAKESDFKPEDVSSTCCCSTFGLSGEPGLPSHAAVELSSTQVSFLLQIYRERVDPFVKVLSADSLANLSESWYKTHAELDASQAALRSNVVFVAIVALTASEVKAAFERPKDALLVEMRAQSEKDLARAKYLTTRDLAVVQALVIYTSILPYANMQDIAGPISAATVQIAVQNELHLENGRAEQHDRDVKLMIWIQICFLSSRFQAADRAVSAWLPDATAVLACRERFFTSHKDQGLLFYVRYRIWSLSQRLKQLRRESHTHDAESLVSEAKADVNQECQQLLASHSPLADFVQQMAKLFFVKIEHAILVQKWQRANQPPTPAMLCDASITTLEAIHALNTRAAWAPWRWQLRGIFPWAAMRMVFLHFADARWTPLSERAWVLASAVVGGVPDELRADPAWPALCRLMDVAERHRETEMVRIMADAMAQGDYMQIVEAGQRVFYSEGLGGGQRVNEHEGGIDGQRDGDDSVRVGSHDTGFAQNIESFGAQQENDYLHDFFV